MSASSCTHYDVASFTWLDNVEGFLQLAYNSSMLAEECSLKGMEHLSFLLKKLSIALHECYLTKLNS